MKVIGFNLTKSSIERKETELKNITIDQNINILDVQKDHISLTDDDVLRIKFDYTIDYSKGDAVIQFVGSLITVPSSDDIKKYLKAWEGKDLPEDSRVSIFNFIMNKCTIKALSLEDEFGLPFHIKLPKISSENKKDN